MHADRPGDRPRLLYWYRTAPGIALGRSPLDEDAIRTIEENHPDIDFDWPAILALSEVMTPEDEAPRQQSSPVRKKSRGPRRDDRAAESPGAAESERVSGTAEPSSSESSETVADADEDEAEDQTPEPEAPHHVHGLLEELVGREIATRLRARYSEIMARIHEQPVEASQRDAWAKRAEALDPDLWVTPDAILDGVRGADQLFDRLRAELHSRD